ncbi:hypothetical protein CPB84DRAFT_1682661 [Gymnopilus junonius]|uniref:Glucose receptor Git3 N-terminal domain-containing protein n=1 Tax=Gymnopilus junonius TaxID=109634 RepID=A0A9P5NKV6_GYMJU|nr:hypothetical protein CPB84DRAFT_1682661 [Gymnopilus junonius]
MLFSFNERLGIFFTVEGAFLSILAVTLILFFVVYKYLRRTILIWGEGKILSPDATDSGIFLNLMLADLVQGLGIMPNIRWMEQATITEGHICTAQAVLKQVGIVGVSMSSLAIAIQTFAVLILRWRMPRHFSKFLVLGIWVFDAMVIGIPNIVHRNKRYYGDTGYWCWILDDYRAEQIVTEYLWSWTAGFVMLILYGITFMVMRGWIIVDNGVYWYKNYTAKLRDSRMGPIETEEDRTAKAIANMMLFYPAVYIITVLPNSISRWLSFSGSKPPYQFTLFANTVFALSGMFNAILFFATRPELVKGPSIDIESTHDLPLHPRKESTTYRSSLPLGRLPERTYSTSESPLSTGNKFIGSSTFDPTTLVRDHRGHLATSPASYSGSLKFPKHTRNSSYYVEYGRSKESSSMLEEEEEDYGRLPG